MKENNHILSTNDFAEINWHDCKIYGFAFDDVEFKFYIDIDLIIEWIEPTPDSEGYSFRIAPATLVFKNVWNLVVDIDTNLALDIDSISMQNPHPPRNKDYIPDQKEYDWNIRLSQGEITFNSIGFDLFIRKAPEIRQEQSFGLKERGGISFSTKTSI